jgi:RNA polymerase sigma-70 factor (ECF subfamily)
MACESDLLAHCRRGDSAAWDELFAAHYAVTARFIFTLGSDFTREDADEICQEAFLSVIRNLDSFHGDSQFQTWLFRIAANKARDFREKQQAVKRGSGRAPLSLQAEDPETGLTLDPPSLAPSPDASLLRAENVALVHRALAQVGEPCRELIELRYFGDQSYDEIGAELKLNSKTVSSRLSRCLDRLESVLQEMFAGEQAAPFPSNG